MGRQPRPEQPTTALKALALVGYELLVNPRGKGALDAAFSGDGSQFTRFA
jgi:hypothetical protein